MTKPDPWTKICDDLKCEVKNRTDISKLHITQGDLYFTYKNTYQIELNNLHRDVAVTIYDKDKGLWYSKDGDPHVTESLSSIDTVEDFDLKRLDKYIQEHLLKPVELAGYEGFIGQDKGQPFYLAHDARLPYVLVTNDQVNATIQTARPKTSKAPSLTLEMPSATPYTAYVDHEWAQTAVYIDLDKQSGNYSQLVSTILSDLDHYQRVFTNYGEPDFGQTLFGDDCHAETVEIDGVLYAHYTPNATFQISNDKQDPCQLQVDLYVPFNNQEPYLEIRHPDPNRKYEDLTYHAGDHDIVLQSPAKASDHGRLYLADCGIASNLERYKEGILTTLQQVVQPYIQATVITEALDNRTPQSDQSIEPAESLNEIFKLDLSDLDQPSLQQ